jgi:hypothetical protein
MITWIRDHVPLLRVEGTNRFKTAWLFHALYLSFETVNLRFAFSP